MVADNPTKLCEYCGGPRPHRTRRFCSITCKSAALTISPADRFWALVDKDGPVHPVLGTTCWLWIGSTNARGYGQFNRLGRRLRPDEWRSRSEIASRVAYALSTGHQPPNDMDVCHHCDNPPCVRPDHLFLGTRLENVHDMIHKRRDRKAHGEQAANVKLTEADVRQIRADYRIGIMPTALGRRFGVSARQIHNIVTCRSWTHLD